jgi:hypothetical protein
LLSGKFFCVTLDNPAIFLYNDTTFEIVCTLNFDQENTMEASDLLALRGIIDPAAVDIYKCWIQQNDWGRIEALRTVLWNFPNAANRLDTLWTVLGTTPEEAREIAAVAEVILGERRMNALFRTLRQYQSFVGGTSAQAVRLELHVNPWIKKNWEMAWRVTLDLAKGVWLENDNGHFTLTRQLTPVPTGVDVYFGSLRQVMKSYQALPGYRPTEAPQPLIEGDSQTLQQALQACANTLNQQRLIAPTRFSVAVLENGQLSVTTT